MTSDDMDRAHPAPWRMGTRPIRVVDDNPSVTVVLDDPSVAKDDTFGLDEPALEDVEVLASFAGPTRSTADVVGEIVVVVQQIGFGVAGSGIWAGVQALIEQTIRRRTARTPGNVPPPSPSGSGATQPATTYTLTVLIPTDHGPALVHQSTVGVLDLDAQRFSLERIVQSIIDDANTAPPLDTDGD